MKHRTVFYSINHPLPKKLGPEEELFPVTASVHPIHKDCPHENGGECSQMWDLFIPLFGVKFIRWGAVGIIKEKISQDGAYQYSWHIYTTEENDNLQTFADNITKSPKEYLLLGNIAEYMFDRSEDKESLPCLAIIEDAELDNLQTEGKEGNKWLDAKGWSQTNIPFINEKEKAWKKYIEEVEKIAYSGSIIYIPTICHHPYAEGYPVLAGGLIWCIQKGELKEAIKHVAEAQLFLRWTISELLTLYPHLGRTSEPMERITNALKVLHELDWKIEMHNGTPPVIKKVQKEFEFSPIISNLNGKLHEGVKSIMLDDVNYEMPLDFLVTLMKSVAQVEVIVEDKNSLLPQLKFPINVLQPHDPTAKKSFLMDILSFVRGVPYLGNEIEHPKQNWYLNILTTGNAFYLTMQASSEKEKLSMTKLDDNLRKKKKKGDNTLLWEALKEHAPYLHSKEIEEDDDVKIGFSLGSNEELVLFWKKTDTPTL